MRKYKLLPFKFTRLIDKELLVSEVGDYVLAPNGTVKQILEGQIAPNSELYKDLLSKYIICVDYNPLLQDVLATRLRTKKSFLNGTALHIFILTLRCNQKCIYCQALSQDESTSTKSISKDTLDHAINLMLQSPNPCITMEFQGGEPSLEPKLIKYGIELAEEINKQECRKMTYVLCTNCRSLSEELLELCKQYNVYISTSLDGPSYIHNKNRGREDSYEKTIAGIRKAREVLGDDAVSALMTTSELALDYPKEIVDEYVKDGFHDIFLRALNPYGLATENEDWERYNDRFVDFYKAALDYIIELNKQGEFFREAYATIILRKILTPYSTGFVDLQSPAGTVNSVIIYNYDGYVYASDESRMLAENGDYTFRLGKITDKYEDIVYSEKVRKMGKIWANETLAGCSDCPIRAYCGADPVRNHSTQGDMYGYRPSSFVCKKNKAIIEHLISLIIERGDEVLSIFKSWIR